MSDTSKVYPQSIPYQPPPSVAAVHDARLRRWTGVLVVMMVATVVLIIGFGGFGAFVLVKQMKALERAEKELQRAGEPEANSEPEDPNEPSGEEKPDPASMTPDPAEKEGAPLPRERFLTVIGLLMHTHLYQSRLNIGLIADCTENEVYTAEEAQQWLDKTVGQLEILDKQLDGLKETQLNPEERRSVNQCREASALLRTQAKELREYWKNNDKDHVARYHKAREAAWSKVDDVLRIKDPDE